MAAYEYDDFWVEFSPRAGGGYSVAARAPDGETSKASFQLPFTNEQLEAAVRTLGYTRSATTRDIGEVSTERRLTAEQLGGELADALLVGPTGDLYNQARSAAIAKGHGVRLWLSLGKAPGLLSVPWEFLYLQPTFLASQRKTPIVRFLSTHAPVAPRRIENTVRILGVVASPDGLPKLDVAQERKRVDDALGKARQDREVTIDWLDPATRKELRLALQQGEYHILHFVGHSGYVAESDVAHGGGGGGVLFLENENRSAAQVSDAQLVNLLADQDSLRLVVLNSCEGARTSAMDPFAGIATSIVALGIPAVVAMQFEISDEAAITFAEELYQSLIARQDPIDVAVAEARKAVFTEVNETEWATPVLFLRNEDGRLFDFAPVAEAGVAATAAGAKAGAPAVDDGIAAAAAAGGVAANAGSATAGGGSTAAAAAGAAVAAGTVTAGDAAAGGGVATAGGAAAAAGGAAAGDATIAAGGVAGAGTLTGGPPSSGTPATWMSPTGPRPMGQGKDPSLASRPWIIGLVAVVVVVLLLGGMSAAGLFGPVEESPGPSDSSDAARRPPTRHRARAARKGRWLPQDGATQARSRSRSPPTSNGPTLGSPARTETCSTSPPAAPSSTTRPTPAVPWVRTGTRRSLVPPVQRPWPPRRQHASLIGSVDGTGDPFFVGSGTSYPCQRAGNLFLGINDIGVANNSGAFVATVERSTP